MRLYDPKKLTPAQIEMEEKFWKEKRLPCMLISACTLFIGSITGIASMPMGAYYAPISFILLILCSGGLLTPFIVFGDFFFIAFLSAEKFIVAYQEAKPWERALPICVYIFLRAKRAADKSEAEVLAAAQADSEKSDNH